MTERVQFIGLPEGYHTSLGRFVDAFSRVELALFFALAKTANVPMTTAQAIFSDARIDRAKDTINRIRAAHGLAEDAALTRAFAQLGEIARIRNNLMHHGTTLDAATDSLVVSNALVVPPGRRVQSDPISVDILEAMIFDLMTIRAALTSLWFASDRHPPELIQMRRDLSLLPWRYKPAGQAPQASSTRSKRRERKRPPESSPE